MLTQDSGLPNETVCGGTPDDRKPDGRKQAVDPQRVKYCPRCGSQNIFFAVEWFAHSLDPQDMHNTTELNENQCQDCCRSFWTG